MYTEVSMIGTKERADQRQVGSMFETAETIRDNALNRARMKMPPLEQNAELAKLLQRRDFVEYLKHAIAQEVAEVLASNDRRVQAIFLFEESTNPDAETEDYLPFVDLTVRLLALVTSPSAAFEAFVSSLDRVLSRVLCELPSTEFARRTSFLDVLPVTQSDVEQGHGYARLLSSVYARPLRIWERA